VAVPDLAVAFTVSGQREEYLLKTLTSWSLVRGIENVRVMLFCEPERAFPAGEVRAWCARTFASSEVIVNERQLGCSGNTAHAMQAAFMAGVKFAVLAEEDIVVSRDVLEYFGWAQRFQLDPKVAAVCAHTYRSQRETPANIGVRIAWFSPLVWGTWSYQWAHFLLPGWRGSAINPEGWDQHLRDRIVAEEKECIFPGQSRSRHIGQSSTLTKWPLSEHFYGATLSDCFSKEYPVQQWAEAERTPALGLVV
jgi:hypothetical protein